MRSQAMLNFSNNYRPRVSLMKCINGYLNTAHNCQFELDVLVILH